MSNFQHYAAQVHALANAADAPTVDDRKREYSRISGVVLGLRMAGAITAREMLQINRDLADQWYAYDEADIAERKKAQEEADKDDFLSGE
jgi:hypothetical protein